MLRWVCPVAPPPGMEVARSFAPRNIVAAFHDIDGTHSKIRDWVPVMTLVTGAVSAYGMPPGDAAAVAAALRRYHPEEFPEAHTFAIESAGLSALTQMEWALRRARRLTGKSSAGNERVIAAIAAGEELAVAADEPPEFAECLRDRAALLFRAYEILLCEMSRDANLAAARRNPEAWRIPGSLEFLEFLRAHGVKNYFVTGAVVEYDAAGMPQGTMYEEICALGFPVGPGRLIEAFRGSTWRNKLPKPELMRQLVREYGIAPEELLVVGDGRSEIQAAVELGALALSRLDFSARRAREIHRELGTNLIVPDYASIDFPAVFS